MHIGIDYSSRKVSAARLDDDGRLDWLFSYNVPKKSTDPIDNLNMLLGEYARDRSTNVDCASYNNVCIEAPIVGRSGAARTAVQIAMVAGALIRYEYNMQSVVELVPPATWKKRVCGRGNMTKESVGNWLEHYFPEMCKRCSSDDEVDAVCLAMYSKLSVLEKSVVVI